MRTINTINQAETTTLVNRKLHLTYQCPAEFEGSLSWTQPILSIPAPCSPKNITLDLPYTRANWLGATAPEDECEGLVQLFGLAKQFYGCN